MLHSRGLNIRTAMLLQLFRHPCCLVAWSDFFLLEFPLGRFLAQPVSPGFTGFSFSRRGGKERKKEERAKENPVNPRLTG